MTNKVLVAYASNAGSTIEVAEAVGKTLSAGGATVDVKDIGALGDIGGYDAYVFAAPMIIGWHKGMRDFLKAKQGALAGKPVAYLITLLNMVKSGEESYKGVPITWDPAHGLPMPAGGKLDMSKLNLFGKLFIRFIIRHQESDFRNWEAINAWAESLPSMMA